MTSKAMSQCKLIKKDNEQSDVNHPPQKKQPQPNVPETFPACKFRRDKRFLQYAHIRCVFAKILAARGEICMLEMFLVSRGGLEPPTSGL